MTRKNAPRSSRPSPKPRRAAWKPPKTDAAVSSEARAEVAAASDSGAADSEAPSEGAALLGKLLVESIERIRGLTTEEGTATSGQEAGEYLAQFFEKWREASSPANRRRQFKLEVLQDWRSQVDRLRRALQVELEKANARGDHQAVQIVNYALIRLIRDETAFAKFVEELTERLAPGPDYPASSRRTIAEWAAARPNQDPLWAIRHSSDGELEQFVRMWVANEKKKSRNARMLAETVVSSPDEVLEHETPPKDRPPDAGWKFVPGKAAYKGKEFYLAGLKQRLLKRFVEARNPLCLDDLRSLWVDGDVHDQTIRTTISQLRRKLRTVLELDRSFNPLPLVGRGRGESAWELTSRLR